MRACTSPAVGRSGPKDKTFAITRPGLVVDIGSDGEVTPRWMDVSIFTPVAHGQIRGPMVKLGLAAN